ncbi:MAG TPA: hypothetical protein VE307_06055 [Nitrososphaeraceae archaeon]|jgi:hypothetical protein|nr:hypothetical protein [Nitrososphaeraceae archaeon]
MRTLRLLNLHCNKIIDTSKPDETFLTVEGIRFQGFGPESMNNENEWNINADILFNEQAIIRLYDENLEHKPNFKDHLKSHIVEESYVREGLKTVNFSSNSADYILSYEIV